MPRRLPIDQLGDCLRWALPRYGADRSDWIMRRLAEPLARAAVSETVAAEIRNECGEYQAVAVAIRGAAATAELLVLQVAEVASADIRRVAPSLQDLANRVLSPLLDDLSGYGVRFLQANCDEVDQATMLAAVGFQRIADVALMSLPAERFSVARRRLGFATPANGQHWLPLAELGDRGQSILAQLLAETFIETEDCPRLNHFLSGDRWAEVFLAAPTFDPELTSLLRDESGWAGCLLLSRHRRTDHPPVSAMALPTDMNAPIPDTDEPAITPESLPEAIELVYMGVIPSHRGRGWGSLAVTETLRVAEAVGAARVVLAVDLRNRPAASIYRRAGWSEMLRESVWGMGL